MAGLRKGRVIKKSEAMNYIIEFVIYVFASVGLEILWLIFKNRHIKTKPTPETRSVAILGHVGAGKTTLWKRLRDEPFGGEYHSTSSPTSISEFKIRVDDKEVIVKDTKDVGGGNDAAEMNYNEVLEDGTFIYYLIELKRMNEFINDIRAQVQKIAGYCDGFKNFGFKVIFTNFDRTKTITKQEVTDHFLKLNLKEVKGLGARFAKYVKNYDGYNVLNIFNDEEIVLIKKEIIDGIKGLKK